MSETPPPQVPYLPDIRRVVTGHNQNGTAITIQDDVVKATFWSSQNPSAIHEFYRTEESPPVIDAEVTSGNWVDLIKHNNALISPNGSVFRAVDLAPGQYVVSCM